MALNHINLGLTLSEKCISKPSQDPTSTTTPEWLVRRRLWTTLIVLKGWIFSTTDLLVEINWHACHQMLRDFQFTTDMHWRDAIQLEMAKITTIKADVRSTLHDTKNFQPQIFAEARYQLQGWCRDLPESMCLHSLLDNDLLATEDRSRTLFTHLTYLSGLMLLPQYLAREWITKNFSTADLSSVEAVRGLNAGFSAAEQSARMLSLLRPQQDIIVKRWFCT
ncbi:hypothetical protein VTO58DRAFT_102503 [Aureobasidium pullulans]|nr:hypothetical protein JADG_003287 [Aureobasidium pullulans]